MPAGNAPVPGRAAAVRADNEKRALAAILDAIREVRYGAVTIILQDGLVVQVERTEKRRLLTRREVDVAGEGDGI